MTTYENISLESTDLNKTIKKTENIYLYHQNYYKENAEILRQKAKERSKRRYDNDEEYKQQKIIQMRERARIKSLDPEYRAKLSQKKRELYNKDAEYRNKIKQLTLDRLQKNPELKEKINQKKRLEYALDKEKILKAANTKDVVDTNKNINYLS